MKISPLQLDELFIGELSIKPAEEGLAPNAATQINIQADPIFEQRADDPSRWKVALQVSFDAPEGSEIPYEGRIACTGFFTIASDTITEETKRQLIAVNCPSILYSTAREVVAAITARGPHGKMLLPSVSFIDLQFTNEQPSNSEPEGSAENPDK